MNFDIHQLDQFILPLLSGHPKLVALLSVLAIVRLIMKPLQTFVLDVVKITPTQVDDGAVQKLLDSKFWKAFAFIVDYLGSIKLPGAPGVAVVISIPAKEAPKESDTSDVSKPQA